MDMRGGSGNDRMKTGNIGVEVGNCRLEDRGRQVYGSGHEKSHSRHG